MSSSPYYLLKISDINKHVHREGRKRRLVEDFSEESGQKNLSNDDDIILQSPTKKRNSLDSHRLNEINNQAKESNDKIRNLESIKKELEYKRATIDNRFPYSRYGNKRDTYSYNRVRNLLFELKNIILNHGYRIVTKSSLAQESFQIAGTEDRVKCWKYCTDYLQIATSIAQDLPEFDLSQNNTYKHETLTSLAALFSTVISRMEDSEFTTKNVQSINSLNRFLSRISKRFPEHFGYVYSELLKRIGSDW